MKAAQAQTPDFDITVKLRNNHLVAFRESLGFGAAQFAEQCGVSYASYILLESMKESPIHARTGRWRGSAQKIAAYMGVSPDEIWPDVIQLVQCNTVRMTATREQIAAAFPALLGERMLPPHPDQYLEDRELAVDVCSCLGTLTPREEQVLILRFGLDDGGPGKTWDEIGALLGRSRNRIGQIEKVALRKLRHSSRSRHLKEHVCPPTGTRIIASTDPVVAELINDVAEERARRWAELRGDDVV